MASPGWKYSEFCQESVKSENQIFIFITLCPSVQCSVAGDCQGTIHLNFLLVLGIPRVNLQINKFIKVVAYH